MSHEDESICIFTEKLSKILRICCWSSSKSLKWIKKPIAPVTCTCKYSVNLRFSANYYMQYKHNIGVKINLHVYVIYENKKVAVRNSNFAKKKFYFHNTVFNYCLLDEYRVQFESPFQYIIWKMEQTGQYDFQGWHFKWIFLALMVHGEQVF